MLAVEDRQEKRHVNFESMVFLITQQNLNKKNIKLPSVTY